MSISVSLTGGNQPGEGAVQVTYDGKTRYMCDDDFDDDDNGPTVVCRMLGYTYVFYLLPRERPTPRLLTKTVEEGGSI